MKQVQLIQIALCFVFSMASMAGLYAVSSPNLSSQSSESPIQVGARGSSSLSLFKSPSLLHDGIEVWANVKAIEFLDKKSELVFVPAPLEIRAGVNKQTMLRMDLRSFTQKGVFIYREKKEVHRVMFASGAEHFPIHSFRLSCGSGECAAEEICANAVPEDLFSSITMDTEACLKEKGLSCDAELMERLWLQALGGDKDAWKTIRERARKYFEEHRVYDRGERKLAAVSKDEPSEKTVRGEASPTDLFLAKRAISCIGRSAFDSLPLFSVRSDDSDDSTDNDQKQFQPRFLFDGKLATAWGALVPTRGLKYDKKGGTFELEDSPTFEVNFFWPQRVQAVRMIPGFGRSQGAYFQFHRVRKVRVDGNSIYNSEGLRTYFFQEFHLADNMEFQRVRLDLPVTKQLVFSIQEIYPGRSTSKLAVSELSFTK